ncbi:MAG: GH116 family glycosyl-hydrolase, partial [Armatimonadetes bacterium]|nr:GH116 family glycosyl-hydrolase [Armatimonadota bacterium]
MTKDVNSFLYTGRKTNEISFPLGGIGAGCIGLAGNGRLIDWEIFNKPNKGGLNGFSHFAIKAECNDELIDARVLNGDLPPPYTGTGDGKGDCSGFGFGPSRSFLAGLPHFESVDFLGEFPIAKLDFKGAPLFPGKVTLTAFNPFIPLNDIDSGIPGAFFDFEVTNTSAKTIKYSLIGALGNPLPANNINIIENENGLTLLHLTSAGINASETNYGDLSLATDAHDTSYQRYWYEGAWFDQLEVYWRDMIKPGKLLNRDVHKDKAGANRQGMIAAHFELAPGESKNTRFLITWNFPNCENYWNSNACDCAEKCNIKETWKNYYATIWKDSKESAKYAFKSWERLFSETLLFKNALFESDIPIAALDAVSANISILKTPTVLRLEDGAFYAWEGCLSSSGCCEGSCTHVWNYAQALPFLF